MKLDEYVGKTVSYYYSDLSGVSTEEFYKTYCEFCRQDNVLPKAKTGVIRQAKWYCDVDIIEKRKTVVEKYFAKKGSYGYKHISED